MLDVLVIGSGPAGLCAALYAKRAGLTVMVAEKIYLDTGQIADSSQVDNYLGLPGRSGYDLGEAFRRHVQAAAVEFYDGNAVRFEKTGTGWNTVFENGEEIASRTVIYAAGATHRKLGAAGEEKFTGRGVSYCAVCDGAFYRGKAVAVVGGGDTALDDALYLSDLCEKVYLIHRRDEFRGSAVTLKKLQEKSNVEIVTAAAVEEIQGDAAVSGVLLNTGRRLAVSGVFVAVGMLPQTDTVQGVARLDQQGYIQAAETGETSADGFFCCRRR